jgi:hypothetical protein
MNQRTIHIAGSSPENIASCSYHFFFLIFQRSQKSQLHPSYEKKDGKNCAVHPDQVGGFFFRISWFMLSLGCHGVSV